MNGIPGRWTADVHPYGCACGCDMIGWHFAINGVVFDAEAEVRDGGPRAMLCRVQALIDAHAKRRWLTATQVRYLAWLGMLPPVLGEVQK